MPGIGLPLTAEIKVNGAEISSAIASNLIDVRVEQVVSAANRAVVRFSDADFKLLDASSFKVSDALEVSFGTSGTSVVSVFKGEVTSIALEQGVNARHELVVEAYDKSHRLSRASKPMTFLKSSYADVISQLAQESGLTSEVASSLGTTKHDYIVKSGTTTEFFNTAALRYGATWYVDDSKVVFKERSGGSAVATVTYGEDLLKFRARFSEIGHAKEVTVRSWDYATKKEIVGTDTSQLSSPTGGSTLSTMSTLRSAYSSSQGTLLVGASGVQSQADAEALAKAVGRRQSMGELVARGEVIGNPVIRAGSLITVKNVGTTMSGDYFLTSVEHLFGSRGDLATRFTAAGGLETATMVDLLHGGGSAMVPWDRSGVVIGIVTNNKDDSNAPGGEIGGRVKVKFPTLSQDEESNWARVVSPGAGANRGLHIMPNVDDEVLVAFEQGDPNRPVVIGGLFNGKDKPWGANADVIAGGKVVQWGIQTMKANFMKFLDGESDDKNGVEITLADGVTTLHIGKDMTQLIANNKPIEIKSGEASIVLKDGNITIKATKVTIESTADMALKAGAKLDVKATAGTAIDGGPTLEVKASAKASVTSGGMLELKGTMTKIN